MKKISLFSIVFMTICLNGLTQMSETRLTFTSVYFDYSSYIPPDSIHITNITRSVDTVLYFPDTVLILDYGVGIPKDKSPENSFRIFQNSPNPVIDNTTIKIYIPEEDNVTIRITDVMGRVVTKLGQDLQKGYHSYLFTPGYENLYLFTATWKRSTREIKITNAGSWKKSICTLKYNGYNGITYSYKSADAMTDFVFEPGDSLFYTGFATINDSIAGSDVKGDIPLENKTYTFKILEGIPCVDVPLLCIEGRLYKTVHIGSQCWLKENLNVGTLIDLAQDQTNNGITEKYCYSNDESYCDEYGGLYQWNEAMQYTNIQGTQGLCPSGWHIPTDDEWTILCNFMGGETVAGGKLKETGLSHWKNPNTGATNSSGFTARGAGFRGSGLPYNFFDLKRSASFWSSSQYAAYPSTAWIRYVYNNQQNLSRGYYVKICAWSVRCIKN